MLKLDCRRWLPLWDGSWVSRQRQGVVDVGLSGASLFCGAWVSLSFWWRPWRDAVRGATFREMEMTSLSPYIVCDVLVEESPRGTTTGTDLTYSLYPGDGGDMSGAHQPGSITDASRIPPRHRPRSSPRQGGSLTKARSPAHCWLVMLQSRPRPPGGLAQLSSQRRKSGDVGKLSDGSSRGGRCCTWFEGREFTQCHGGMTGCWLLSTEP